MKLNRVMIQPAFPIPDKLFFKIGEVCEIVGVQAHVLRYWETEFPMLQPQKNRSGQRTYRRKDVEMALRIKELLYDEGFTIAGAKRKLGGEHRGPSRLKIVPPGATAADLGFGPADEPPLPPTPQPVAAAPHTSRLARETLKRLKSMAEDLLTTLERDVTS
jgi:DNA-binding transcriptional MerR regulator